MIDENPYRAPLFVLGALRVSVGLACVGGILSEWDTGTREAYIRHAYWWGAAIFGVLGIAAIAAARKL